jgi:hypothetical protein
VLPKHRSPSPLRMGSSKPSSATLTKRLLNTLSDESNPITHSDIYERSGVCVISRQVSNKLNWLSPRLTDHVFSLASGHQRSERHSGIRTGSFEERTRKWTDQREEQAPETAVLSGVRLYINGYLSDTTDIEMKRVVTQGGGQIMSVYSPSVL